MSTRKPGIRPDPTVTGSRTGSLDSSLTVEDITAVLGFGPNVKDDPYKVTHSWGFRLDGRECGIWDYKGSRWSTYGDLSRLFPSYMRE